MFALFWNLSTALHGYTRFYMPPNIAIDLLRTPRGLKWAIQPRSWRPRTTCWPRASAPHSSSAVARLPQPGGATFWLERNQVRRPRCRVAVPLAGGARSQIRRSSSDIHARGHVHPPG